MDEPPFALVCGWRYPLLIIAKGGSFSTVSTLRLYSSTSIACGFLYKRNRAFPTGNALLYISLSYVDFSGCVRVGAPCFCFAFNLLTHGFRPPACMICYRLVAGSVIFSISSNVGIAGIAPWRLVVMLAALLAKARMPSSLSTVRVFSSSFQSLDRAAPKKVSPAPLVSPTLQGTPATWPVFSPKR